MSKTQDGGPAYPFEQIRRRVKGLPTEWINHKGMSLRDVFAGNALQGMLAYHNPERGDCHTNATVDEAARYAYAYADAMLAARKGGDQ